MVPPEIRDSRWTELRRKAEAVLSGRDIKPGLLQQQDVERLLQEMQIIQVELEVQNAELTASRNDLENSKKHYEELYCKYANLFDLAPNAYLTISQTGIIKEANLTAAILLGMPKQDLIGRPVNRFIHRDDQSTFHFLKQDAINFAGPQIAELSMVHSQGRVFPAQFQLESQPCSDRPGTEYRVAVTDLSEKIRLSANLQLLHQCLEVAAQATAVQPLAEAYVQLVKRFAKCSAVGIRLRDEHEYIPYVADEGFSKEFHAIENLLSLKNCRNMCCRVALGLFDPSKPYFTAYGSFYVNGTSRFRAVTPAEELGRNATICNDYGYESVALIPIVADQNIMGLLHLVDRRENAFPLRMVQVLEQAAMRLGLGLQRLRMHARLNENLKSLQALSSHLLIAREVEQHRIAMELHDQVGQDLNVLKLELRNLLDRLRKDQPTQKRDCRKMLVFTDQIIDEIRRITKGLSPPALENLGMVAAVQQMAREFSRHAGIPIETDIAPLERIIDQNARIGLYRIIQEAMTNMYKHSQASRMTIRVVEDPTGLELKIQDNGRGFDFPDGKAGHGNGMGLSAMNLRSSMIGAQMTIQSRTGEGTCLTVRLPVAKMTVAP